MSQATSNGLWPSFRNRLASLAQCVVLPAPCRPHIMMTVGGFDLIWMRAGPSPPPMRATSSSFTIFITCWAGVRLSITSWPIQRSVTVLMNPLATV